MLTLREGSDVPAATAPDRPGSVIIGGMLMESATIDALEGRIIRCLQLAPRIPFSAIAEIIDVSEQTVARRYRKLVRTGVLRVTAVINPAAMGQSNWIVRTQCKPSGAGALAEALAQRDDVSWVSLVSGGSEIICVLRARTSEARDDLLTQRLPRTAPVLGISAVMVLHRFLGGGGHGTDDWAALGQLLEPGQHEAVLARSESQFPEQVTSVSLDGDDLAMLDVLAADGRASYSDLARAAGVDEGRATRRIRALVAAGAAYFDVDISVAALGFGTSATLWLTVAPAELDAAGRALAAEPEVAFAAAISGPQNLTASIVCVDVNSLYRFVTERVGAVPGVQRLEISPVLRHVKQAGALTSGDRLLAR
jgi:DNA-binding Lrp family transcriptional regulator